MEASAISCSDLKTCGLAFRASGRKLSRCSRSTIVMMRLMNCLLRWSPVSTASSSSALLEPFLFTVLERTGREGWHRSLSMDPRSPLVVLISEPGSGSPTIWSTRLRNVLRSLRVRYHHYRQSGRGNLQPLMRLSVADPRRVVSVFWLLVSLASQHRSLKSFDSVEACYHCSSLFLGSVSPFSRVIGTARISRSKIKNQSSSLLILFLQKCFFFFFRLLCNIYLCFPLHWTRYASRTSHRHPVGH